MSDAAAGSLRATGRMYELAASPQSGDPWQSVWSTVTCTVLRAGTFRCGPRWAQPERVMPCHVMLVSRRGSLQYEVAGRSAVLPDGGVIVMPPHVAHSGTMPPGQGQPGHEVEVDVVHFTSRAHGVLDAPALLDLPIVSRPTGRRADQIRSAARTVVAELRGARPAHALAANSACGTILAMLWREAVDTRASPAPLGLDLATLVRFSPVFELIRDRHDEPLRVDELAAAVALHPVYFAALFKRGTGIAPMHYLRSYRLARVRDLLAGSSATLDEIARRTGLGTASYLSRVFLAAEGMTPGEYRRRQRGADPGRVG